jgi:hypothetical protein
MLLLTMALHCRKTCQHHVTIAECGVQVAKCEPRSRPGQGSIRPPQLQPSAYDAADCWHSGDATLPTTGDMMLLAGGCATLMRCDATLPTMC